MIACATTKGKKPYLIKPKVKFQDPFNKTLNAQVNITRIVFREIKRIDPSIEVPDFCYDIVYEIKKYIDEPIKFYFRFIPTNNFNSEYYTGVQLHFYNSDINGTFIHDISGRYPSQFMANDLNVVFTDIVNKQPYYCTVANVDEAWHDTSDNVYIEVSEFADFHVVYRLKIKQ